MPAARSSAAMSSDALKFVRAAAKGDDAKVKRLLKAKADVNHGEENGDGVSGITALHEACGHGHIGAVRLLLKAKATVDLCNSAGGCALFGASDKGHLECVRLLLKERATVDLAKKDGATSLYVACQNGHLECVRLLLEAKATIDQTTKKLATPSDAAAVRSSAARRGRR